MNIKQAKEITDSDKLTEAEIDGLLQKHGYLGGLAQWPVLHEGAICYLEAVEKAKYIYVLLKEIAEDPDLMGEESFSDRVEEAISDWEAEK